MQEISGPKRPDGPPNIDVGSPLISREDALLYLGVVLIFVGLWLWARPIALVSLGLFLVYLALSGSATTKAD